MTTTNTNSPERASGILDRIKDRLTSAGEVLKDATVKQLDFAKDIIGINTEIELAKTKESQLEWNEKRGQREVVLSLGRSKNRAQRAEMITAENGLIRNESLKKRAREVMKTGGFETMWADDLLSLEQLERGVLSKVFAYKRTKGPDGLPIETPLNTKDVQENDEIVIDFWRNASANAKIGAADLLPPSIRVVKIIDRDMNVRIGTRQVINGRSGYYDINGKYLPIYNGFTLRIPTAVEIQQPEYAGFKISKSIEQDTAVLSRLETEDAEAMTRFRGILEKSRKEDATSSLYELISTEAGSGGTYQERLGRMISISEWYEKKTEGDEKVMFENLTTRLRKTKEILGDKNYQLDLDRYKSAIAKHESEGRGYFARNDDKGKERGVRPGAWAFGKYQFTVETLRAYGVDLWNPPEETKIQWFLENPSLQEEIMDRYILQNLEKHILPNQKIAEDMSQNGTSLSYYLALTHIGGPGALNGKSSKKDWLGTSIHPYAVGVSNAYERSLGGDQIAQAIPRIEAVNGAKITPEALIIAAEKHMGKPYKLGANGDTEIDCSQLIVEALKTNRVVHSRYDTTAAGLALNSRPKSPQDVERGDLVFLRQKGVIAHVAIALGTANNGEIEIIDASSDAKKVSKRTQKITSSVEVGTPYFYA